MTLLGLRSSVAGGVRRTLSRSGRTPGKSVAGITVRMADGSSITTGAALIRNLLLIIPILWPLALIVMLVDERNQGHHDKGASTVVVAG